MNTIPAKAPLLLPRSLTFLASLWLIGSWVLTMGLRTPVQPVSQTYTPGVRRMLICASIGLLIGWPLLRLSQRAAAYPIRQTLLDLFVLLALVQVVIWPLRLVTAWSPARTAALDVVIMGWTLLSAAVVASTMGTSRTGPRSAAMIICVMLLLFGPLVSWIGMIFGANWMAVVDLSPLMMIERLGQDGGGAPPLAEQWQPLIWLGVADVVAWLVLLVLAWVRSSRTID